MQHHIPWYFHPRIYPLLCVNLPKCCMKNNLVRFISSIITWYDPSAQWRDDRIVFEDSSKETLCISVVLVFMVRMCICCNISFCFDFTWSDRILSLSAAFIDSFVVIKPVLAFRCAWIIVMMRVVGSVSMVLPNALFIFLYNSFHQFRRNREPF